MAYQCECGAKHESAWEYCPACGRYGGRVEVTAPVLEFRMAAGGAVERSVTLRNPGNRPITYEVWVDPPGPVRVAGPSVGTLLPGEHGISLSVDSIPPADAEISLRLLAHDGPRSAEDPWGEPERRELPPVPIRVVPVAIAPLQVLPELVVLGDNRRVREIELINPGEDQLPVVLPQLPPGIEYVELTHQGGVTVRVPPLGRLPVPVRLRGHSREQVFPAEFRAAGGQSVTAYLIRQPSDDEVLPAYIVGIDFGTRNSSVFVRRTGTPAYPDEVAPAVRDGTGAARFPSAMYRSKDGEWFYGEKAIEAHQAAKAVSGEQGTLIRNIKRLIHHQEEAFEKGDEFKRRSLLRRFLRYIYGLADAHILQRYGHPLREVEALFVLSVPLLDEERNNLMRRELGDAMREVLGLRDEPLENRVLFVPEPICAALFILLDKHAHRAGETQRNDDRSLRFQDGDQIVIFDSGGGTTDVVAGKVKVAGSRVAFEVLAQVGLTREHTEWGGENITQRLAEVVLHERIQLEEAWLLAHGNPSDVDEQRRLKGTLIDPLDPYKIAAVRGDKPKANLENLISPEYWDDLPVPVASHERFVTVDDVNRAVVKFLDPVLKPVSEELFGGDRPRFHRSDISYLFPVGGNTLIPRLRTGLRRLFEMGDEDSRLVLLEEDQLMVAVARGAVWVPGARLTNATQHSLALTRIGPTGEEKVWSIAANAALHDEVKYLNRPFQGTEMGFRLEGSLGRTTGVLWQASITPPDADARQCYVRVRLRATPEGPELALHYCVDPQGAPQYEQTLFSYRI